MATSTHVVNDLQAKPGRGEDVRGPERVHPPGIAGLHTVLFRNEGTSRAAAISVGTSASVGLPQTRGRLRAGPDARSSHNAPPAPPAKRRGLRGKLSRRRVSGRSTSGTGDPVLRA